MIAATTLKDAERIVRVTMVIVLLTAGSSKLFSDGGFYEYYSQLFQGDLRIGLPAGLVNLYLSLIPYVEILLGLALLVPATRRFAVLAWFAFMWSLLFGHYVLQEWSAVNQMLGYIFLGLLCFILPYHSGLIARDNS
ncbi:MAG: MauE/DoxX family redox-associated membrane protein [Pseudomonadota bacterium]